MTHDNLTILTTTFNSGPTIRQTLESVASQSFQPIDHIIIDGRSSDDTLTIAKEFKHVTKIICQPDDGLYHAMNKGLATATSSIIGILNSDDYFADDRVIEDVMRAFQDQDIDAVYGDLTYVDQNDTTKVLRKWISGNCYKSSWIRGWMPPHPAFFIRKKCYDQFGLFDLRFKSAADYELMLRMCYKHKIKLAYLPRVLVKMRAGGQSNASFSNRMKANREDRLAWKVNGLRPSKLTLYLKPIRKFLQFL